MLFNKMPLLRQVRAGGERTAVQHELAEVDLTPGGRRGGQDLAVGFNGETLADCVLDLLSERPAASGRLALGVLNAFGLAGAVQEISVHEAVAHGPLRGLVVRRMGFLLPPGALLPPSVLSLLGAALTHFGPRAALSFLPTIPCVLRQRHDCCGADRD